MIAEEIAALNIPEVKVFFNHIYELKKGVRRMALYTTLKKNQTFVVARLKSQNICYEIQEIDECRINVFMGCDACIDVVRMFIDKPLS